MPMDARDIETLVAKAKDDIIKEVNDRLPRKVGVTAVNHFKQNFRDGGWLDNGLHPWKRTRRQDSNSPDAKYGPLTSRRNHMMRSIQGTEDIGTGDRPDICCTLLLFGTRTCPPVPFCPVLFCPVVSRIGIQVERIRFAQAEHECQHNKVTI